MKPKLKTTLPLFRLRIDEFDFTYLLEWFESRGIKGNLVTSEVSSAGKEHLHCVFASDDKVTALRTSFKRTFPGLNNSRYSFSQNWSKETKSNDMKLYMSKHNLNYQDIHIIYILKDGIILSNTLIENTEELDFEKIRKEIGCKPKKDKKYGNYLKKLIMDYNLQYPEPLIESSCTGLDDYPERERIFKFVTHQMSAHNLDIFLSNAKLMDDFTIKKMCQSVLNTRKFSDIYPDCFKNEVNKYYFN